MLEEEEVVGELGGNHAGAFKVRKVVGVFEFLHMRGERNQVPVAKAKCDVTIVVLCEIDVVAEAKPVSMYRLSVMVTTLLVVLRV